MDAILLLSLPPEVTRGAYRYAQVHDKPWRFVRRSLRHAEQLLPDMVARRGIVGSIGWVANPAILEAARRLTVPLVNASEALLDSDVPSVHFDSCKAGSMAAHHLLERGLRHFAYVGLPGRAFSQRRRLGFERALGEAGFACDHVANLSLTGPEDAFWAWLHDPDEVGAWLTALPRPTGLATANDDIAERILDGARAVGLPVPEQLAVIGIDDNEVVCEGARPQLSSVSLPGVDLGYAAASLLSRLLDGESVPNNPELISPASVTVRHSTDVLAVDDLPVANALRYIRDNAARPIGLPDVAAQVSLSTRALQLRFKAAVGRPVSEEIRRVRVERAKALLSGTDWPLDRIAANAGFGSAKRLRIVFGQMTGEPPSSYRRSVGSRVT